MCQADGAYVAHVSSTNRARVCTFSTPPPRPVFFAAQPEGELTAYEKMFKAERAGGNYGAGTMEVQTRCAVRVVHDAMRGRCAREQPGAAKRSYVQPTRHLAGSGREFASASEQGAGNAGVAVSRSGQE